MSDPTTPRHLGFALIPEGVHTLTKHPTEPLIYTSSTLFALTGVGDPIGDEVPTHIVDVSNPNVPVAKPTALQGCHDISFHVTRRRQLAFCAAGALKTEIWDVSDPRNPAVVGEIRDEGIGYHHLAVATPDGRYLVIGDEDSGGSCSGSTAGRELGAISVYDIGDVRKPKLVGFLNAPRGPAVCWAHNFNFVPGTRLMVIAWWKAGTSVVDLSDPKEPKEVAHFQPDNAAAWSSYWYDGRIYVNSGSGAWILQIPGLLRR